MRIVILHQSYGCDTGCCGHVIAVDGVARHGDFKFDHPEGEDFETWARKLVELEYPGHSADLDFASCEIVDD